MALTFADLRKRNLLRAALNPSLLAEEVTYLPKGGGQKTITIGFQGKACTLQDRENELIDVEECNVRTAKDPQAEIDGRMVGGVENPQLGDAFIRAGESIDRAWNYAGVVNQTADSWFLIFRRQRRQQVGTTQTQKI